ncbi:10508_t:CDS:10 [Funneliformis geosporum]|uniref:5116_t:CDS:1 n=1 Tax=Funneliformis geosporum TaxID=1117311 RepID=A0A9W4SHJ2_9GLOM|nr:10508_t:CDS:10 [Funneliformis geosporum]CAI2167288.1 5116_t:CDS:10 [Funneliformis geosporum]
MSEHIITSEEQVPPAGPQHSDIESNEEKFKKRHLLHPKSWREFLVSILKKKGRANVLLIFLIPAIVLPHYNVDKLITFFVSFLAIIPLSNLMTIGVEDLSARLGLAYASVLHALSGNFVELVIESYALMDDQYAIVRSAVLGSILCNITLVLGITFVVGSWPTARRIREGKGQHLHIQIEINTFVDTSSSILALAVLALITPAAFKIAAAPLNLPEEANLIDCNLQNISHATAIVLMMVYIGLLVFQLKTHASESVDEKELTHLHKKYNWLFDIFLIAGSVAGISICAKTLVNSIEHIGHEFRLGTGFIGIVLLPICVVSNFIEHYQAISEAAEDKIDTAISLILNTSVQMALLITPILVSVGWIFDKPLTLDFNPLEISVLACAVLIVNYLDNKANWLEGYMLIISYVLIAIAFFYFPNARVPEQHEHCNPWSRNLPASNESDVNENAEAH